MLTRSGLDVTRHLDTATCRLLVDRGLSALPRHPEGAQGRDKMNQFGVDVVSLVRVLVAIGLGALVDVESEANDQSSGLRTHISLAPGAFARVTNGIGSMGAGLIFRRCAHAAPCPVVIVPPSGP